VIDCTELLVFSEDNTNTNIISDSLGSSNYTIRRAKSVSELASTVSNFSISIILLDLSDFHYERKGLIEAIKSNISRDQAIIAITGTDFERHIDTCYYLGCHGYIRDHSCESEVRWVVDSVISRRKESLELQTENQRLTSLAAQDSLTGLYNRRVATEHIKHAISRSNRQGIGFSLLYFDIDDFKRINDSYGHPSGDELLKEVSIRVGFLIRECDFFYRMGGDEFMILIDEAEDIKSITTLADKIINSFVKDFKLFNDFCRMSISIGISVFPSCGGSPEELIKNSDQAMYHAKISGKNCYKFYSDELNESAVEQMTLENDMRQALVNNEFEVYFQPKSDPTTSKVNGAEALIRWNHPRLGFVSPAKFIPVAEKSDLIIDIGKWVRVEVCKKILDWKKRGLPDIKVSVNVSSKEFQKREVLQHLIELFTEYDIDQKMIELEITENTLMLSAETRDTDFEIIEAMDIGLSIDDFGTGYCSLGYLRKYPIKSLKIDKSFVDNIEDDKCDRSIAATIIAMAHNLGMDVIAEGVESREQRDILVASGCENIQGYFYSKPLPAKDFEKYVMERNITPISTVVIADDSAAGKSRSSV